MNESEASVLEAIDTYIAEASSEETQTAELVAKEVVSRLSKSEAVLPLEIRDDSQGYWDKLTEIALEELRELLCTDGGKYKAYKNKVGSNPKDVFLVIAGYIAGVVGGSSALIAIFLAVVLRFAFEVSRKAFCKITQI